MTFSRKLSRTRTTRCSASRKTDCNKHNPYIKSTEKRDAAIADERFILNASSAIAASSFYCFILPALYLLPASLPPGARRCHALDRACTVPLVRATTRGEIRGGDFSDAISSLTSVSLITARAQVRAWKAPEGKLGTICTPANRSGDRGQSDSEYCAFCNLYHLGMS